MIWGRRDLPAKVHDLGLRLEVGNECSKPGNKVDGWKGRNIVFKMFRAA